MYNYTDLSSALSRGRPWAPPASPPAEIPSIPTPGSRSVPLPGWSRSSWRLARLAVVKTTSIGCALEIAELTGSGLGMGIGAGMANGSRSIGLNDFTGISRGIDCRVDLDDLTVLVDHERDTTIKPQHRNSIGCAVGG